MTGTADVVDAFAFDPSALGAASILGFETGDRLEMLNGPDSAEILSGGVLQGDDLLIDFGDGNSLLQEDYAAA